MKMTPAKGRDKAAALVGQFRKDADYYRSKKYKEAHVRNNFIDPFFESLGWDVHNQKGFAPQNREVIVEDSVEIQGSIQIWISNFLGQDVREPGSADSPLSEITDHAILWSE